MKTIFAAISVCILMLSCSKDDTPNNRAPGAFELLTVANNSDGIDLKPTFTWKAAVDPEGDALTYTLFLDADEDPKTVIAENLSFPTFTSSDSLQLVTKYHWKVIAKDVKGASVSSAVNSFTTRTLNFPSDPVTNNAEFSEREGYSMVSFKKHLWILGGYDGISAKNDVWNSSDGKHWKKVSSDQLPIRNLFPPRSGHTTTVFNKKVWVIGGKGMSSLKNDVWSSVDGIGWTEETKNAAFPARSEHTAVAFKNKLWVIGGYIAGASDFTNDVWSSSDGITWTPIPMPANIFSSRNYHSTIVFNDKIWVIGGRDTSGQNRNDVWSSADGQNWDEVTKSAQFPAFADISAVVFDDKIMLLGVEDDDNFSLGIWYTKDGKTWTQMKPGSSYPFLEYPKATVFKNKIWINSHFSKEIWVLD